MLARELVQNLNFLQNLPRKFRVKEQVFDLNQSSVSSVCPPSWKMDTSEECGEIAGS